MKTLPLLQAEHSDIKKTLCATLIGLRTLEFTSFTVYRPNCSLYRPTVLTEGSNSPLFPFLIKVLTYGGVIFIVGFPQYSLVQFWIVFLHVMKDLCVILLWS